MEKLYFLFCGTVLALFGTYLLWSRLALLLTGLKAHGRVIDWEPRGRKVFFHPVITFIAADGLEYRFTSPTGYSTRLKIESLPVLYRESRPSHALVYSVLPYWGPPLVVFILAAAPWFLLLRG